MNDLLLIRIPLSHRARDKAERLLNFKPQSYHSFYADNKFWYLTLEDFNKIKHLNFTKVKNQDFRVGRCWPSEDPRFLPNQPYKTP